MTDLALRRPSVSVAPLTLGLALRDMKGITKRNLLRIVRTPQLLFMTLVQPTIILLLFRYVLGGAIRVPDAVGLARAARGLLSQPAGMRKMGRAASETVRRMGGASLEIMATIEPYLAHMSGERR